MKRIDLLALATLILTFCTSASYATNGYFSHGYGSRYKAFAGAGVAFPIDAWASAINPAALVYVGKRLDIGISFFSPDRQHTVTGNPSGFPGTFGLAPGTVESGSTMFAIPALGFNWMLGENSAFGVAMYGNGGMNTDYDFPVFGVAPTGVNMAQLFVAPTYALRLAENHSVGVTGIIAYQYFEAKGLAAFGPFSSDPTRLTDAGTDSSLGLGARIGYLGNISPFLSVGASYKTKIRMSEFDKYAGLFAEQGGFDIPQSFVIGTAIKPNEKLAVLFDVQWINYSAIRSVANPLLPNLMTSSLGADDGAGFGWEDSTVFKFGLQWMGGRGWTWRGGYSYGGQPIPETETLFNIISPGVIEQHVTFGLSKQIRSNREFNVSVMRAFTKNVEGPNLLEAPGAQSIELSMNQWELDVSFTFTF